MPDLKLLIPFSGHPLDDGWQTGDICAGLRREPGMELHSELKNSGKPWHYRTQWIRLR